MLHMPLLIAFELRKLTFVFVLIYQDLQFSLPLNFPLHSIMVNKSGDLLALYGPKHIVVAEIPELKSSSSLSPLCTASLVSQAIPFEVDTEFLKVSWHPFSEQHLVVLTNDNTLRFVNVEQIESGAEQTFTLDEMIDEDLDDVLAHLDIVNFCFGDASVASWQAFCVYLLNRDSDVYALCPVVPYGCRISAHYFSTLKKFVYTQLDEVVVKYDEANIELSRARRRAHAASSAASLDMLNSQRLYLESQLRWISSVTGQSKAVIDSSFEIITCDPNYAHRTSQSSKRSPSHLDSTHWYFDIVLQGPLETQLSLDDSPQSAAISSANVPVHDLFAISAIPMVLGRSHCSGHVEILVGVNHAVSPGWSVPGANFEPNIPTLLLWSGVDLSINSGSQQAISSDDSFPLILLPTPPTAMPRLAHHEVSTFLLYSSCGIVKVDIPWLHHIDTILSQSIAMRTRDLPSTQLTLLWNSVSIDHSMPLVLGASSYPRPITLSGPAASDPVIVLSLFENGPAVDVCSVPRPSTNNHLVGLLSSTGITSSGELAAPQTPAAPARLAPKTFRGSSTSEALSNSYNLQFYQQLARQFDSSESQLQAMEENIRNRISLLEKRSAQDSRLYKDSCARLSQAASEELEIVSSFKRQQAILASFSARFEAVNEVVRFAADRNAGVIDSAWIAELEKLKSQLEKQSQAMESMEAEIGGVASELKKAKLFERGIPDLDSQQASAYTDTLDNQQKSIAALSETIRKLQVGISELDIKSS